MAFPKSLAVWTALGGLTAYRALVRPCRAVIDQGDVVGCPGGPGCGSGLTVRSSRGVVGVYALVSGQVTRAAGSVDIAGSLEPVILSYSGAGLIPLVGPGQTVKVGQVIAQADTVTLSVTALQRLVTGAIATVPLEPATWLASRGLRAVMQPSPSAAWCAQGRKLVIPQAVAQCGMRLPDPSGFSLLPVSARLE